MKTTGRPLILTAKTEEIPAWVRARDVLLTGLLWLGCGWMWRHLFPEVERWYLARSRADLEYHVPAVVELVRQGLLYAGILLCTYLLWSYQTWRAANRDTGLPAPPQLPADEEARVYGVPPEDLPALRTAASVTMHTGRDGRISAWQPGRITPATPDAKRG